MKLQEYKHKRNFQKTAEPRGKIGQTSSNLYLIQKHAATRLHYDLRLAMDGVLKSWAVPKGPSLNPSDKRLAVHVEDHPLDYGSFEGTIPKGQYGGGTVMMWDRGEWVAEGDPHKGYEKGHLRFQLKGQRLHGRWALIRMGNDKNWLLVKEKDDVADEDRQIVEEFDTSVITRRSMDEIAAKAPKPKTRAVKTIPAASTLPLARKASFPETFKPQLATLADEVPIGDQWIHEVKYDGYRLLSFIHGKSVKLITRNGLDWTDRFPTIAAAIEKLALKDTILDGEAVVQKEDGTTDFQALQNALRTGEKNRIVYYVFDLPYSEGQNLQQVPLIERKKLLKEQLAPLKAGGPVRYSDHIEGKGKAVFQNACHYALEGILSKNIDSAYQQARSTDWLKIKCSHRQEFVIGGYTEPKGGREHFGSLLIGTYDRKGHLNYTGHVGTGFNQTLLTSMSKNLKRLRQQTSPFHTRVEDKLRRSVSWVKPELVCEVQFAGWTADGVLRHPSFEGLREDKKAREVVLERASAIVEPDENKVAGVILTHPDRVLYPEQGITKRELCLYYEIVAKWMLPHIQGRPLALVRCPQGEGHGCFFQKHPEEKRQANIVINDVQELVTAVQMGALEFHPWGSTEHHLEYPDRMVFDLDPAPGVTMGDLVTAARLVRDHLSDKGLTSFVKTTGGKGLHVVVPIKADTGWEEFKNFTAKVANDIVKLHPAKYIATMSKTQRTGKIFIDFFRNGRGSTSVAPYSSRARKGAPVSMPLSWDDLSPRLKLEQFTVRSVPKRLMQQGEAWRGFFEVKQSLPRK